MSKKDNNIKSDSQGLTGVEVKDRGYRVTKIRLLGYIPFNLSETEELIVTLDDLLIAIIGTNGCGKSMFMQSATPLPIEPSVFRDGGGKTVWLSNGESTYVLKSYRKGAVVKCKFNLNGGRNLNPGLTKTIQSKLVSEHFGLTPLIHKCLINAGTFSTETPAVRKEIFLSACPLDLRYAMTMINTVATKKRDAIGVIKHVEKKLHDDERELAKIALAETDIAYKASLELAIQETTMEINNSLKGSFSERSKYIKKAKNGVITIIKSMGKLHDNPVSRGCVPLDILERSKVEHDTLINSCISTITRLSHDAVELEDEMADMQSITGNGDIDPKKEIAGIKKTLSRLPKPLTEHGVDSALYAIKSYSEAMANLVVKSDQKAYNKVERANINIERSKLSRSMEFNEGRLGTLNVELTHLRKETSTIVCRTCSTAISSSGESIRDMVVAREREIYDLEIDCTRIEQRVEETEDDYIGSLTWASLCTDYVQLVKHLRLPEEFKKALPTMVEMFVDGISVDGIVNRWIMSLDGQKRRVELLDKMKEYETVIKLEKNHSGTAKLRLDKLKSELKEVSVRKVWLTKNRNAIVSAIGYKSKLMALGERLNKGLLIVEETEEQIHKIALNDDFKTLRGELYDELNRISSNVNRHLELVKLISSHKSELESLYVVKDDMVEIETKLSFQSGYIGEQLSAFIATFLVQVNRVIAIIWEYKLKILMCGKERNTFDYNFPFLVQDSRVKELKKASVGQAKAVNLAFSITLRWYLGLNNTPIVVDEVISNLDPAHSDNLVAFIRDLHNQNLASQVFIVDHRKSFIDNFPNCGVLVLDDRNVELGDHPGHNLIVNEAMRYNR